MTANQDCEFKASYKTKIVYKRYLSEVHTPFNGVWEVVGAMGHKSCVPYNSTECSPNV